MRLLWIGRTFDGRNSALTKDRQMNSQSDAESIRRNMEAIRLKRSERVLDLHLEVNRLVDWKEYVRVAPMASLIGSVAAGFIVANSLSRTTAAVEPPIPVGMQAITRETKATTIQWLGALLLPIATNAAKNFISQTLSQAVQGYSNELKPITDVNTERRSFAD